MALMMLVAQWWYYIERKFRETWLCTGAPVSNNLVQAYVGEHVLGMPRSY